MVHYIPVPKKLTELLSKMSILNLILYMSLQMTLFTKDCYFFHFKPSKPTPYWWIETIFSSSMPLNH